jgi:hypothetical protein
MRQGQVRRSYLPQIAGSVGQLEWSGSVGLWVTASQDVFSSSINRARSVVGVRRRLSAEGTAWFVQMTADFI